MTNSAAKSGLDVHLTVHLMVHRQAEAGALFSDKYEAKKRNDKPHNKKAAGPERPASAAGRGPFGLR